MRNYRIAAVASRDAERTRARAAAWGVAAETPEGLLARDDIDVVLNLTPPAAHAATTMAALAAGRHVFSEKTLGATLAEAKALARAAEARGLRLGVAPELDPWRRHPEGTGDDRLGRHRAAADGDGLDHVPRRRRLASEPVLLLPRARRRAGARRRALSPRRARLAPRADRAGPRHRLPRLRHPHLHRGRSREGPHRSGGGHDERPCAPELPLGRRGGADGQLGRLEEQSAGPRDPRHPGLALPAPPQLARRPAAVRGRGAERGRTSGSRTRRSLGRTGRPRRRRARTTAGSALPR